VIPRICRCVCGERADIFRRGRVCFVECKREDCRWSGGAETDELAAIETWNHVMAYFEASRAP
jgi:hypothetical protein